MNDQDHALHIIRAAVHDCRDLHPISIGDALLVWSVTVLLEAGMTPAEVAGRVFEVAEVVLEETEAA